MPRMQVAMYTGGSCFTNGYVIECSGGIIVVDCPYGMAAWLKQSYADSKVLAVLLTHQHFDHVEDVAAIQRQHACKVYAQAAFSRQLTLEDGARSWGLDVHIAPYEVTCVELDKGLQLGGVNFDLLHVPGHSPDSLVFVATAQKTAFVGDCIFAGSIGRTDLPHGNHQQLLQSIRTQLFSLQDDLLLYPGHGEDTDLAHEKIYNPFVGEQAR